MHPTFHEDFTSQLPALRLLMNMGWTYLSPQEAMQARGGRSNRVLLEDITRQQLQRINSIQHRGKQYEFSDANLQMGLQQLRDLPIQQGFVMANRACYELLIYGRNFEQLIEGDRKSYQFQYIDWKNPERNTYHVTEEFEVVRSGRNDHYRPDLVLFVNGIPWVVIECKRPDLKGAVEKAIEQHMRNQQDDGIRELYYYNSLVLALSGCEGRYATTATAKEYWSVWKEPLRGEEERAAYMDKLLPLLRQLPADWPKVLQASEKRAACSPLAPNTFPTAQDELLYGCCHPQRLLKLVYHYTLYDNGTKKVARYQQFSAIERVLQRIAAKQGVRYPGGVIWHTQGSGKSLTMVMLAEQLLWLHPNAQILLATDRTDLDGQITDTFRKCGVQVSNATTGLHLLSLIQEPKVRVITSIINKFENALKHASSAFESPNIFVLVDEGHRSQYGSMNVRMEQVFPNACFLAFTGTPLMGKEKNTAQKFGGVIDTYTITDAVADGAVVPLLYEGRDIAIQVSDKGLDSFFERIAEPLNDYQKAELKRKVNSMEQVMQSDPIVYAHAWDISEHFAREFKGTGFKGQLVTPSKDAAIRYKRYLDEIGKVSSEVIISAPDMREGEDDAFDKNDQLVHTYWKQRMDEFGNKDRYESSVISRFKNGDDLDLIIVVDKLLTGFDAPRNRVLYLARTLKGHTLLQAIARVNRLAEGKDYGLIIDYRGNLQHLQDAIDKYGDYQAADMEGLFTNVKEELKKLPQLHSEVWALFPSKKLSQGQYEEVLADEALRVQFYERLSAFSRLLKLALSTYDFVRYTPAEMQDMYKNDLKFFLTLRASVRLRYSDEVDFAAYEKQLRKLINQHLTTDGEVSAVTGLVDLFALPTGTDPIEQLKTPEAKADHIASRTIRALDVRMDENPTLFRKLSELIRETIQKYRDKLLSGVEYLEQIQQLEGRVYHQDPDSTPAALKDNYYGLSIFHTVAEILPDAIGQQPDRQLDIALAIDKLVRRKVYEGGRLRIDWQQDRNLCGSIKTDIDDYLFELKQDTGIEISFDQMDELEEQAVRLATLRFVEK